MSEVNQTVLDVTEAADEPASVCPPRWVERDVDRQAFAVAQRHGLSEVPARVFAARMGADVADTFFTPSLRHLDHPKDLPDVDAACRRIWRAHRRGEPIILSTDHDADGTTSAAILYIALTRFGVDTNCLHFRVSNRLTEGYGLNDALAQRILEDFSGDGALVITADNGSSDEARIARLRDHGIETCVTDHHEIPKDDDGHEAPPVSALAFVSPTRSDSVYPDDKIAGCMVAWLVMKRLSQHLIEQGLIESTPANRLRDLLPIVAVGTVADCVNLGASVNNRAVVSEGLAVIEAATNGHAHTQPCWHSLSLIKRDGETVTAEFLAFQVCPRLASPGRIHESMPGIRWLLSPTHEEALERLHQLNENNEARKLEQNQMVESALTEAARQVDAGARGIAVYLEDGHPGVHGIVASRMVERFGRPTVMLSPRRDGGSSIAGSVRSAHNIHVRKALAWIDDTYGILKGRFGGHHMAAGLSLDGSDVAAFQKAWDEAIARASQTDDVVLGPVRATDGALTLDQATLELLRELHRLEPWGNGFPAPTFTARVLVREARMVGERPVHCKLTLEDDNTGSILEGIWFNAIDSEEAPAPIEPFEVANVLFHLNENNFRGEQKAQAIVEDMQLVD